MTFDTFIEAVQRHAVEVVTQENINTPPATVGGPLECEIFEFLHEGNEGLQVEYVRYYGRKRHVEHSDALLFDSTAGKFLALRRTKKGAVTVLKTQPQEPITLENFKFHSNSTTLVGLGRGWVRYIQTCGGSTIFEGGKQVQEAA